MNQTTDDTRAVIKVIPEFFHLKRTLTRDKIMAGFFVFLPGSFSCVQYRLSINLGVDQQRSLEQDLLAG
jgi:hypothetical protein